MQPVDIDFANLVIPRLIFTIGLLSVISAQTLLSQTPKVILLAPHAPNLAQSVVDSTTLQGKVLFGYQGWFRTPGDGSSLSGSGWSHWSHGIPSPETMRVDLYPDLSEFDPKDLSPIPGETIGSKPAYLFSSLSPKIVLKHFEWMRRYDLDGVLVQRFLVDNDGTRREGDQVLRNVMSAAQKTGRTFAIEYDVSGANEATLLDKLQRDWSYLVDELHITSNPRYLHHEGKPVVSVWGMGLSDQSHPPSDTAAAADIVRWFQNEAGSFYVGGTPAFWREQTRDASSDPGWNGVYQMMDAIQPWTVGRYGDLDGVDRWKINQLLPDLAQQSGNHKLYMPVIFPGFSWHNLNPASPPNQIPRLGGEFLWRQAVNARSAGAQMLKIAMFDEVNEATAMFKAVSKRSDAPDQGYWLTLDADGKTLPPDWYLRLARKITRAFHNQLALPTTMPRDP